MKALPASQTQLPQERPDDLPLSVWPSEVGIILGLSPYMSPLELWMEKTKRAERPDLSAVESIRWGNLLEPVIAAEYAERSGVKLRRVNRTIIHPRFPWWRGRIDYQVLNQPARKLLEVKNCSQFQKDKWGEDGSDSVPDFYAVQVHAYMPMDLGFDYADLAALIGGNNLRRFHIERDKEMDSIIETRLVEWHQWLVDDVVPPPMTSDDLQILYPRHIEDVMEATEEILADIDHLKNINGGLKELTAAKDEITERLKMFTEGKEAIGHDGAVLATWRTQKASRIDVTKLKAEMPAIAEWATVTGTNRVLRIK